MPHYTYSCICSATLVITRAIADRDTPTSCPTCKAEMKRTLEFSSVQFKGSGFYKTDK